MKLHKKVLWEKHDTQHRFNLWFSCQEVALNLLLFGEKQQQRRGGWLAHLASKWKAHDSSSGHQGQACHKSRALDLHPGFPLALHWALSSSREGKHVPIRMKTGSLHKRNLLVSMSSGHFIRESWPQRLWGLGHQGHPKVDEKNVIYDCGGYSLLQELV